MRLQTFTRSKPKKAHWTLAQATAISSGITKQKKSRFEIGLRLAIVPGILLASYLVFLLSKLAMPWMTR